MTIEQDLFTRLSTYAGLTALVGTRVYPLILPQTEGGPALPAVTYARVTEQREHAMGAHDPNIVVGYFQIDAWASSYSSAVAVRDQIVASLSRWSKDTGTVVDDVFVDSGSDLYEDDTETYHLIVAVRIFYRS